MPGRILLAWEAGGGRGHIITLRTVAQALGDGYVFDAALCRMDHAAELAPLCDLVFPASYLHETAAGRAARGHVRVATWADFLGDIGFADPGFLIRQIGWWIDVLKARQSRLVIAEFAPCAMLAARALGIPVVSLGTGYGTPPASLDHFPLLLPEHAVRLHDEAELLASLNTAGAALGLAPFSRFAELYDTAAQLSRTIAQLDPYAGHRRVPYLAPFDLTLPAQAQGGREVLCYFSTHEHENAVLMEAIAGLGLPTRLVMPRAGAELRHKFAAAGAVVEQDRLSHAEIARHARILVHAGQHGALCLGLALGLPQVAVPQLVEQACHARHAAALGTTTIVPNRGQSVPAYRHAIRAAYHDAERAEHARALSDRLRPQLVDDLAAVLRQRLAAILPA